MKRRGNSSESISSFGSDSTGVESTSSDDIEQIMIEAFKKTDEGFSNNEYAALIGTTAVVSMVGNNHIFVGYCGN